LTTRDCTSKAGLLDFYEIHFNQAMVALRTSLLRKFKATVGDVTTVPLGSQEPDGPEVSPEVEVALETFWNGDPQKIDDPACQRRAFQTHALPSPALSSAVARRSAKCASTFSCETAGRRSSKTSCTLARNQASCAAASTVAPKLSSMAAARSFPSASMRVCTSAFATIVASK
jgi:hypothetical protein